MEGKTEVFTKVTKRLCVEMRREPRGHLLAKGPGCSGQTELPSGPTWGQHLGSGYTEHFCPVLCFSETKDT